MKPNKFILFYVNLILMLSLISISGNNSIIRTKNLKSNINDKRTLQESNNNYMIIQFSEKVNYKYNVDYLEDGFRNLIEYMKNGDIIIRDISQIITIEVNTTLEIYFKENVPRLDDFFSTSHSKAFGKMITVDLSHFDTSSVTNMKAMFYG